MKRTKIKKGDKFTIATTEYRLAQGETPARGGDIPRNTLTDSIMVNAGGS